MVSDRIRTVGLGKLGVAMERRADGTLMLRSTVPLGPIPPSLTSRLTHWAEHAPERIFLAERAGDGRWRTLSFGEAHARVQRIATSLLARDLSADRPVMILSGNSIRHALLALAAMHVGIPYAPISTAYSLISSDFGKLRHIADRLTPGLVFAETLAPYARAIAATILPTCELVTAEGADGDPTVTSFATFEAPEISPDVATAHAGVGADTIAKLLFTSGSTGAPKGVINTQRMLCQNQAMLDAWLPFHKNEPPVLLDWLPWNHTFGGNHNFGLVLWNGGTLWIDDGKPMPGAIEATVRNLRDVSPTLYFNVPKGFEALLPHLERDAALRASYFRRLRINFYSGASLNPHVAASLDRIAVAETGERIRMVTGFGSTETAPASLVPTEATPELGVIGVPLPGIELKLVDVEGKREALIRGGSITPGYWREPALTAAAFDTEGFYKLSDALKFAHGEDAARGLIFDGRIAEDFKLASGTWVSTGPLRLTALAALSPLARDIVLAGHDRDWLAAMVIPDFEACRALLSDGDRSLDTAGVLAHPDVIAAVRAKFTNLLRAATGSSTRIRRLLLLAEPPSIDAGEITDKGSINQRAVLERRAALVELLYAEPPSTSVIAL